MTTIHKLGEKEPTILLLPGLLNSSAIFAELLEELQKQANCYVVDYTWQEDFSIDQEVENILTLLAQEQVEKIDVLYGISMGVNIGLNLLKKTIIPVQKCFFDGGLFFSFPKLVRIPMYKQVTDFMNRLKSMSNQDGIEAMKNHSAMKQLFGTLKPSQDKIISDIVHTFQEDTEKNVKGQLDACFGFRYPTLDPNQQEKITFLFGEKDPSFTCKEGTQKNYPNATVLDGAGLGYGEMLCSTPNAYADILMSLQ